MFVQVIQGQVSDAAKVRAQLEKWVAEVSPGADGWLGSTAGVTEDGRAVALARFESEEAARRNSDRPEQGAWWAEMAALFSDEPVFHDSTGVEVDTQGDPSDAGFVQVMQGRTSDPERAKRADGERPDGVAGLPPGHLGHDVDRPRRRRLDDGDLLHVRGGGA